MCSEKKRKLCLNCNDPNPLFPDNLIKMCKYYASLLAVQCCGRCRSLQSPDHLKATPVCFAPSKTTGKIYKSTAGKIRLRLLSRVVKGEDKSSFTKSAMPTTLKPNLVPSPNPSTLILSSRKFSVTSPISRRAASSRSRLLILKCNNSDQSGDLKDALAGMVEEGVEELLKREENRGLLDGLEKASQRVESARKELAEIERQELEAKRLREYVNQLESRASEVCYMIE